MPLGEHGLSLPLSVLGINKPQTLYPKRPIDSQPRDLNQWERLQAAFPLATVAVIELAEQNPEIVAAAIAEQGNSLGEKFTTLVTLGKKVMDYDIATRAANGTNIRLAQTEYGKDHHSFRESDLFGDHGHAHTGRLPRLLKLLTLIDRNHPKDRRFTDAMALFPKTHDAYQLDVVAWNTQYPQAKIKSKQYHAEFGAIMLGAQTETYAVERHISLQRAQDIMHLAQIATLIHDQPRTALKRLYGTVKAYRMESGLPVPIADDALLAAYKDMTLDITTLSNAQLMKLPILQDMQTHFPTEHWLHPLFEEAKQNELAAMAGDTTPWFLAMSEADRRNLANISTKCNAADVIDMIYPSIESLIRKINVEISTKRDIFVPTPLDQFTQMMQSEDGNIFDDDHKRALWESLSIAYLLKDVSSLSPYLQKKVRELVIYSILDANKVFKTLMQGEKGLAVIDHAYRARGFALGIKVLRKEKHGLTEQKRQALLSHAHTLSSIEDVESFFLGVFAANRIKTGKYTKRFRARLCSLKNEQSQTMTRLRKKPGNTDNHMQTYAEGAFESMDERTYVALDLAADILDIPRSTISSYVQNWKGGARASFPTGNYDKIGSPTEARTLVPPHTSARKQLAAIVGD